MWWQILKRLNSQIIYLIFNCFLATDLVSVASVKNLNYNVKKYRVYIITFSIYFVSFELTAVLRVYVIPVLGTRYGLACTKKGVEETTGATTVSLCSSCWVWRELPPNYFPRYINELICDESDNACLSGK